MDRILIIETDPAVQSSLRTRVQDLGHEVVAVDSAARGLAEVRSSSLALVLLAEDLGGALDGYELARRLRNAPTAERLPLLMYSELPTTADRIERALEGGCHRFLGKVELAALGPILRGVLDEKRAWDDLAAQKRAMDLLLQDGQPTTSGGAEEPVRQKYIPSGTADSARLGPDGVMLVDSTGVVLHADRWITEALGCHVTDRALASLLPSSGLEAFVRDARTEPRTGLRFDIGKNRARRARSVVASVTPLAPASEDEPRGLRVVSLFEQGQCQSPGGARRDVPPFLQSQLASLTEAARSMYRPGSWVGHSLASRQVRIRLDELVGDRCATVIRGPAGTGKEFCARILHYSARLRGPFLQLRCPALTPQNLDRELFGYERGTFPGAALDRPGLLSLARGGTLYLEEVGELSKAVQAKLLERMEASSPIGNGTDRTDGMRARVRWIVSSSTDLRELVANGSLLAPLFTLWNQALIEIPPLRDRPEDLIELANQFLSRFGVLRGVTSFSPAALSAMREYDWPGNVDELEICVERACLRAQNGRIELEDLTRPVRTLKPAFAWSGEPDARRATAPALDEVALLPDEVRWVSNAWDISEHDPINLEHYEKKALLRALDSCKGDKLAAAKLLNLGKSTLYRKLRRFGIT